MTRMRDMIVKGRVMVGGIVCLYHNVIREADRGGQGQFVVCCHRDVYKLAGLPSGGTVNVSCW